MLEYIPEGEDDAAIITLEAGVDINVWKERDTSSAGKDFILQWKPNVAGDVNDLIQNVSNGTFKAITFKSCSYTTSYEWDGNHFDVLVNHLRFLKYSNKQNKTNMILNIQVNKFNDLLKLQFDSCDCDSIQIKYNGYFSDHIQSLTNEETKNLVNLPKKVRLFSRDNMGNLIIHKLMFWKKGICNENLIKQFVTKENSNLVNCDKRNVLHFACDTDDLTIVKNTIKHGGPIEQTESISGRDPSDWTSNEEIKKYLKEI